VVVGKAGEEIWVDKYGRIKVKFPWDPDPAADETSSCWVRVTQNWAGKKWGIFFLPRIGQEVIVDFLEGDPDRPIVTGRVYNAENMPPYDLPANQTQSTIKSNSSKGGQGFNEIRFEDKKGEEDIFIHAEKNMDIRVKTDRFENIGNNRHLVVEKDKFEHVKNKRHEIVDVDHMEHIKGDYHQNIDGKEAKQVTGSKSLQVADDVIEVFKKNHSEVVTNDFYLKADNIVLEGLTNVTIKVGNNYIAIEKDGIKIGCEEGGATIATSSTGDTKIDSQANLNMSSTQATKIEATSEMKLGAPKITVSADMQIQVTGGTQAEFSSSGQTVVKGSVVMIN
jgi:type VI secretion system secreted protein VgrG